MNASERSLTTVREAKDWTPESWKRRTAVQQPVYANRAALDRAVAGLHELPPLVTSWEVLALKRKLADAAEGRCFLLQGGDCAESFSDCNSPLISNRLKVLLQMSLVLVHGLKLPVVRVGRFAGQYAKPRSADTETRDGVTLPCYRGDIVNAPEFTASAREPDPQRLIEAHSQVGADDELRARADRRWLRRSAPPRILGPWLGQALAAAGRISAHGRGDRRLRALHGDARRRGARQLQQSGFLYFARSTAARLRAGGHAPGTAALGLVQSFHAFPVDRHAHRTARWRPRRVLPRHPQPDGAEARPRREARPAPAHHRRTQPRQRTRPPHADHAHGRGESGGRAAAAPRCCEGRGQARALVL